MAESQTITPESLEYRTEVKQLLDILAHSLYTDREIFLRELLSNASDALNRVQFEMLTNQNVLDPKRELAIYVEVDNDAKTIKISDSGIGMNREELVENLGTIARSGAKTFLQNADGGSSLEEIIGQFGVGFYSAFMVAAELTVTSRSYRADDQAWTWQSTGDSSYTLMPADKGERGTDILIKLKEDADEFSNTWKLEQIIKKHSDYVSFPIYVTQIEPEGKDDSAGDDEKEIEPPKPVNRQTALWRQSPSEVKEEEYNDFYKQLTFDFEEPLSHIHMVADMPVNIRSVLFIPSNRERGVMNQRNDFGLKLYSRKVLIQDQNKDLLPEYFRFVEGVVDSEDIPLNVSREMVQSNPVMRQMQKALTNRVIRELNTLADKEPEKYAKFWDQFGMFLKEGIASDPMGQDSLTKLLRFHSSKTEAENELVSLQQYVDRMGSDQQHIYYVLGEDVKTVARSPHLDYFRANDIEVLYMVDPIDGFMTSLLRQYEEKELKNVDDAGLDLPESKDDEKKEAEESVNQSDFDQLVERFKVVLGDKVTEVRESKQLVSSPCRLVSPENSHDRDLQRIRRLMGQEAETPKKILELNRTHKMIADLSQVLEKASDDPVVDATIAQLFDNAMLIDGVPINPADMVSHIQTLMEAAVSSRVN